MIRILPILVLCSAFIGCSEPLKDTSTDTSNRISNVFSNGGTNVTSKFCTHQDTHAAAK